MIQTSCDSTILVYLVRLSFVADLRVALKVDRKARVVHSRLKKDSSNSFA